MSSCSYGTIETGAKGTGGLESVTVLSVFNLGASMDLPSVTLSSSSSCVSTKTSISEETPAPTAIPTVVPTNLAATNVPTITPTEEELIEFDVFLDLGSWPNDDEVDTDVYNYLLGKFVTFTGVDINYLTLTFEFVPENRRHLAAAYQRILVSSWTLKVTCTVTAAASLYQQIASTYSAALSVDSAASDLVAGLTAACGCNDYAAITIESYGAESADDESKDNNLNLLYLSVLLVIPISFFAFYYVRQKASITPSDSISSAKKIVPEPPVTDSVP